MVVSRLCGGERVSLWGEGPFGLLLVCLMGGRGCVYGTTRLLCGLGRVVYREHELAVVASVAIQLVDGGECVSIDAVGNAPAAPVSGREMGLPGFEPGVVSIVPGWAERVRSRWLAVRPPAGPRCRLRGCPHGRRRAFKCGCVSARFWLSATHGLAEVRSCGCFESFPFGEELPHDGFESGVLGLGALEFVVELQADGGDVCECDDGG